jgi:hypothetical protein
MPSLRNSGVRAIACSMIHSVTSSGRRQKAWSRVGRESFPGEPGSKARCAGRALCVIRAPGRRQPQQRTSRRGVRATARVVNLYCNSSPISITSPPHSPPAARTSRLSCISSSEPTPADASWWRPHRWRPLAPPALRSAIFIRVPRREQARRQGPASPFAVGAAWRSDGRRRRWDEHQSSPVQ